MTLITGGTGFVGSNLVRELLRGSYRVRCLARRPEKAAYLEKEGVQLIRGDVTDISSVLKAITPEIEAVIHLVGILVETRAATFRAVHVDGTRNVLEACKGMGVQRYLHMSALGARADARSAYHLTKWEAEEMVRSSGLDFTIFRPSVIFGKEDRFTNIFASAMRISPFIAVPGRGTNRMQPVFVKDVAGAFAAAVKSRETCGKTLELGGPEMLTLDEVIDRVAQVLGKKRVKAHIPMPLMRVIALFAETFLSKPPVSRDALLMLEEENVTALNALTRVFGITPTGLIEGMRTYLH